MNKNVTRLLGLIGLAGMFATSLTAQTATVKEIRLESESLQNTFLTDYGINQSGINLRSNKKAWPDSTITYTALGEKSSKTVYEYDAEGNEVSGVSYKWENNSWINSFKRICEYEDGQQTKTFHYQWSNGVWTLFHTDVYGIFYSKVSYIIEEDKLMFGYPLGIGNSWCGHSNFPYDEKTTFDVKYDANDNLIFFECKYKSDDGDYYILDEKYEIKYNNKNNPLSIEQTNSDILGWKANYEYDNNGNSTVFESYDWDSVNKKWVVSSSLRKVVNSYDIRGNKILYEQYDGDTDNNAWKLSFKSEFKYNTNGQCIYNEYYGLNINDNTISYRERYLYEYDNDGNRIIDYSYEFVDNKWILSTYTISYPNSLSPNAEVENNDPVDNNNQGDFDLSIHIPVDSVQSGSFVVQLPDGFTLDEANTSLTVDFAGLFDLTITKQENNSWLIEIKPKSLTLNNASLKANEAGKMLHIAYKVGDSVTKGTYNISINSIQFKTPGNNIIPEPAINVPVNVNRWGVGNEGIEDANVSVYVTNHTIYLQTSQAEEITIYNMNGSKFYEATVSSGTTTIDASAFPQGVLIVKGSSGWVKKVVR